MKKNIIIGILTIVLIISIVINIINFFKKEEIKTISTENTTITCEKKSVESNNRNIKMEFIVDIYGVVLKTINKAEYTYETKENYNYFKELYKKYNDSNYSYDDDSKRIYYTTIEEYNDENKLWIKDYMKNYTDNGYQCKVN